MKLIKTKIKDLIYFQDNIYADKRGNLKELFNQNKINTKFIFEFVSLSKKNVIRGLHFQIKKPQAKFISVVYGKIFDVVIDLRKKSKTFGKKFEIILDSKKILLYIYLRALLMVLKLLKIIVSCYMRVIIEDILI